MKLMIAAFVACLVATPVFAATPEETDAVLTAFGAVSIISDKCPHWAINFDKVKIAMDYVGVSADEAKGSPIAKYSAVKTGKFFERNDVALVCSEVCKSGSLLMCAFMDHN